MARQSAGARAANWAATASVAVDLTKTMSTSACAASTGSMVAPGRAVSRFPVASSSMTSPSRRTFSTCSFMRS